MPTRQVTVYLLAALAMVFWGVSYVWTRIALDVYQPVTVMFIRLSVSAFLMMLLWRRGLQRIDRQDYLRFVILSFFSPFCYFIGENYGLLHTSPTVASVMIATIPVFAPMLGFLFFRERISRVNVLGFLISFMGIWVMVLDQDFRFTASPFGIFMLFFAVASALVNMVFLKRLVVRYSSGTIIMVQNALGALFFLPLFLLFESAAFMAIHPSREVVASLLALAVFGSTLAFVFYTSAVRSIGIARTAIFGNLIPVVTALTSLMVLGEAIDWGKVLGMGLVILGLFLTQAGAFQRKRAGQKKAPQGL